MKEGCIIHDVVNVFEKIAALFREYIGRVRPDLSPHY